jgi:hypothetical protein
VTVGVLCLFLSLKAAGQSLVLLFIFFYFLFCPFILWHGSWSSGTGSGCREGLWRSHQLAMTWASEQGNCWVRYQATTDEDLGDLVSAVARSTMRELSVAQYMMTVQKTVHVLSINVYTQCVKDPSGLMFLNFTLLCHLLASCALRFLKFQLWLSLISKRKQRCIMCWDLECNSVSFQSCKALFEAPCIVLNISDNPSMLCWDVVSMRPLCLPSISFPIHLLSCHPRYSYFTVQTSQDAMSSHELQSALFTAEFPKMYLY